MTPSRIFVGNLPEDTNDIELKKAFSTFGQVQNLDIKSKCSDENNKKCFAFVTLHTSADVLENCIKHFSVEDFKGKKLYVTRARESFLERLQRERQQEQTKEAARNLLTPIDKKLPKKQVGDKVNPHKRKLGSTIERQTLENKLSIIHHDSKKHVKKESPAGDGTHKAKIKKAVENDKKQLEADNKRMESMRKKRQEFKEKQSIIKTSLNRVDQAVNKKIVFSDGEDISMSRSPKASLNHSTASQCSKLVGKKAKTKKDIKFFFDDDDGSGEDINFDIKEQFEGKKGQKVLDLQSRYKSDKRFVLDERFIDDDQSGREEGQEDEVELQQADEKAKQLNILQDVLGVSFRTHSSSDPGNNKKNKSKMGMLRFDPSQPEHAKFLAPALEKHEQPKKTKKKKNMEEQSSESQSTQPPEQPKVEVSKEKFYKVSETLKEAIAQPTTFSLRSLFVTNDEDNKKDETTEQDTGYIPLETPKQSKFKNPLEPNERNPFKYDSSDSEAEDDVDAKATPQEKVEVSEIKAIWKENLFFNEFDHRLKEGLAFFNKPIENEGQKERRGLKYLMKKRIYNKDRKNQMFQKKIGGKKRNTKNSYNNNKNKRNPR